jgi:hypothetical protein
MQEYGQLQADPYLFYADKQSRNENGIRMLLVQRIFVPQTE